MNIFKRIFGKKEERVQSKHDIASNYAKMGRKVEIIESIDLMAIRYALYRIEGWIDTFFVIQVGYYEKSLEFAVGYFEDEDTEYAENCAREAFEYLTKEIKRLKSSE